MGCRVLIAHSVSRVSEEIRQIFSSLGHDPGRTATTVEEALALAEAARPELLLMAPVLACGGDGVEAALRIRGRAGCPFAYTLDSFPPPETLARALQSGPLAMLPPPFIPEVLAGLAEAARGNSTISCRPALPELHRMLLGHSEEWVFWLDPGGAYLPDCGACLDITGYSPEDFREDPLLLQRLVHPEDLQLFKKHFSGAPHGEMDASGPFRLVTRSGDIKWVSARFSPVRNPDGSCRGRLCAVQDISRHIRMEEELLRKHEELNKSVLAHDLWVAEARREAGRKDQEHKRIENALREREAAVIESESRLRSIFEAPASVALVLVDLKGDNAAILDFSKGAESLFGYKRGFVLGKPFTLLAGDSRDLLSDLRDQLRRCVPGNMGGITMVKKSGAVFSAYVSFAPVRAPRDNAAACLAVIVDISAEKAVAQALLESGRNLRTILDASGQITLLLTKDSKVIAMNRQAEAFLETAEAGAVNRPLLDFFHGPAVARCLTYAKEVVRTGEEIRFREPSDGLHYAFHLAPVKDENGNVVRLVLFVRDITREIEMETQFQNAQRMEALGSLAGGIAHDFNNILSPILGYTEIALGILPEDSKARRQLKEVIRASHRARELVQRILSMSRKTESEKRPFSAQMIVKEVVGMLRSAVPSTIEIKSEIAAPMAALLADPTEIHQVVMNLGTNAYHAMRKTGGTLRVRLEETDAPEGAPGPNLPGGKYLCFTVSDTGVGIDPAVIKKIFDPYFTTKEQGEGTGLGLATVHSIVARNGGAVTVQSELGKGTAFRVFLPLYQSAFGAAPEAAEHLPLRGSEHILFVDDETAIAQMAETMLTGLGYTVSAHTDSEEALAAFLNNPGAYHAIVTDHTMPKLTGVEFALRVFDAVPDFPVILCTGYSEMINEETALAMGIRCFLNKPLRQADLTRAIRQAIDIKFPREDGRIKR
jgi:PAS domain S-box-containing protein